ncbi:hypothetical protein G6F22_021351 [Rhizopus arrhizus]|nr:hypothetical protein G6F22_021351 [Rhizopus arrhizus]
MPDNGPRTTSADGECAICQQAAPNWPAIKDCRAKLHGDLAAFGIDQPRAHQAHRRPVAALARQGDFRTGRP